VTFIFAHSIGASSHSMASSTLRKILNLTSIPACKAQCAAQIVDRRARSYLIVRETTAANFLVMWILGSLLL
jgi:hypothetical protein